MLQRSEELTIRVTPELKAEINRAAGEQSCSHAAVIRQALLDWAARRLASQAA